MVNVLVNVEVYIIYGINMIDTAKLRTKYVTLGWEGGDDMEAIEVTTEIAQMALLLFMKLAKNHINRVSWNMYVSIFHDVIENAKKGEVTYIIAPTFGEICRVIEEMNEAYKEFDTKPIKR